MNQPNPSIRCPHCQLVNFATEQFCKRCKNNLQNHSNADVPPTVNININFPTPVQPQIRLNQGNQTQPQFQPNVQPQFQTLQNETQKLNESQISGYELQNQTGFEQWRNQQNPQNPQTKFPPVNNFQPQIYPPNFVPSNTQTVWRRGTELVMHRYGTMLPETCVKCGEQLAHSGGAYVRQKYRWHNPLVYIALISPLIYAILASVLSQRVTVDIPLCGNHLSERKTTGKFLIGGGVAGIAAIMFFGSFGYVGFSILIFLAAIIGISLGYEYSYKPLQISKIENDYVYLKNADGRFLNRLPHC